MQFGMQTFRSQIFALPKKVQYNKPYLWPGGAHITMKGYEASE